MKLPRISIRRRKRAVIGFAVVAVLVATPVAWSLLPDRASATASGTERDALADLQARSPGERLVGIATKAARAVARALGAAPEEAPTVAAAPAVPEQRALGKVFDAPVEETAPAAGEDFAFALNDPTAVILPDLPTDDTLPVDPDLGSSSSGGLPIGGSGGVVFIPPTGSSSGGGTSGGAGTSGGTGTSGGGTTPVTPVPEPSTWALMILGFGAIGGMLRRRARKGRLSLQD